MQTSRVFLAALLVLAITRPAITTNAAETLAYKPGRWEMTSTTRMPMMAEPQVQTSTECLRAGDYSAERLMRDQQDCTVTEPEVTPTSIRWTARCPGPNGTVTGRGEFKVSADGERGEGTMTIDLMAGDRTMTLTTEITSRRVGDCE